MYIHWIGRTCLVATMLLLIRMRSGCMQLNTNVIRDRWNVHNFCDARAQLLWNVHNCWETCTTSLKRAQHLWNVRNISEMCTYIILENTGWGRWNTLYPYNIYNIYIYIKCKTVCNMFLFLSLRLWHSRNRPHWAAAKKTHYDCSDGAKISQQNPPKTRFGCWHVVARIVWMRCVGVVHIWPRRNCHRRNQCWKPKGSRLGYQKNKASLFWTMHFPVKPFLEANDFWIIRIMHSAWLRNLLKHTTNWASTHMPVGGIVVRHGRVPAERCQPWSTIHQLLPKSSVLTGLPVLELWMRYTPQPTAHRKRSSY